MRDKAPILVTGAHRTGTTWVGKMLTASGQAAYISEPLNVLHRPGVLRVPTSHWYTYICNDNEQAYLQPIQEMLGFRYHGLAEIKSLRSRKDLMRMGRDGWTFTLGKLRRQRPLIKDPFAVFSIPWFIQRLGCQVVVTVRHPAAFASSLKRLDWPFDFNDLLAQPLLMRDWLEPYRSQLESGAQNKISDLLAQSSLLWRIIYDLVARFQQDYPQIQVVRHEDLAKNPLDGYRALYAALDLSYSEHAQQTIRESSSSDNPKEANRQKAFATRLDSQAVLQGWKKRLTTDEIMHIRRLTEDLATIYYPEWSWD